MEETTQVPLTEDEINLLRFMGKNKYLQSSMKTSAGFKHLAARDAFFGLKEADGREVIVLSAEGYKLLGRLDRNEQE